MWLLSSVIIKSSNWKTPVLQYIKSLSSILQRFFWPQKYARNWNISMVFWIAARHNSQSSQFFTCLGLPSRKLSLEIHFLHIFTISVSSNHELFFFSRLCNFDSNRNWISTASSRPSSFPLLSIPYSLLFVEREWKNIKNIHFPNVQWHQSKFK